MYGLFGVKVYRNCIGRVSEISDCIVTVSTFSDRSTLSNPHCWASAAMTLTLAAASSPTHCRHSVPSSIVTTLPIEKGSLVTRSWANMDNKSSPLITDKTFLNFQLIPEEGYVRRIRRWHLGMYFYLCVKWFQINIHLECWPALLYSFFFTMELDGVVEVQRLLLQVVVVGDKVGSYQAAKKHWIWCFNIW